jgi:hypothetical protein
MTVKLTTYFGLFLLPIGQPQGGGELSSIDRGAIVALGQGDMSRHRFLVGRVGACVVVSPVRFAGRVGVAIVLKLMGMKALASVKTCRTCVSSLLI